MRLHPSDLASTRPEKPPISRDIAAGHTLIVAEDRAFHLRRAACGLNLVRLGAEQLIAEILDVEVFYRASERYGL